MPTVSQTSMLLANALAVLLALGCPAAYWPEGVPQSEYPEHHVACYAVADGKRLWDVKVPPGPWLLKDLRGGYAAPTPCTDGARLYVLFGSSELVALDFDGQLIWRK